MDNEALDLPGEFVLPIEETSPVFNDAGSQSVSATVPATDRNSRLLKAPQRVDTASDSFRLKDADVVDGATIRRGTLNVTEASLREGMTFNIGFDNAVAYSRWQSRKLSELSGLPVYRPRALEGYTDVELLLMELWRLWRDERYSEIKDLAIFPLALSRGEHDGSEYWELLNVPREVEGMDNLTAPFYQLTEVLRVPAKVKRVIGGTVTDVNTPKGYMVSPFIKVWRVIELIFADLGMKVDGNPFKSDPELERLVVLNNAADTICRGRIDYANLMPDSTVEEFMEALWVRFGMVYKVDCDTGVATVRFLKDILTGTPQLDLDPLISDWPKITYLTPQYISLGNATSLDGAEPAQERFEDFARGASRTPLMGPDVGNWQNSGRPDWPEWSGATWEWGDEYDPDYPEPDYPEPEWPEQDDDRDYARFRAKSASRAGDEGTHPASKDFLAREFMTWNWYRVDSLNSRTTRTSTPFFRWDPQPEGIDALELSSTDESVPVGWVQETGKTGNPFTGHMPMYLCGSRHYTTYVAGNDSEEEKEGTETPLAFLFWYRDGSQSMGRFCGERADGSLMDIRTGENEWVRSGYSLLFQFAGGLYDTFWRRYDEILRHGSRSVEVPALIGRRDLPGIDMLRPVRFGHLPCLIDKMEYDLPASDPVAVTMTLRPIATQGEYDFGAENPVEDFRAKRRGEP